MLKFLKINNIALIPSVELEFGPGLTLLTGETGAGKSILIDSLGLLLGARASAELIRSGEEQAVVEAVLESSELGGALDAHGLPVDGSDVILRREIQTSGKGRASVNGALVPLSVLKELAPHVAAIHGQHEPQGLLDPDTHLDVLDSHAGLQVEALSEPFDRLLEVEAALEALRQGRREGERRREMLSFEAGEIDRAQLQVGEEEVLRQEKVLQANAGRLASLTEEAYGLLYEDEASVVSRLGQAYRRVEELSGIDERFRPYIDARTAVQAQIDDLALFLRDYRERLSVSPGRLDEIESRLALIERLKRKYGATIEEILAFSARCRAELRDLASPEEREEALEKERAGVSQRYLTLSLALSKKRRAAAEDLTRRVHAELALLAMEKTHFAVRFVPDRPVPEDRTTWTNRGLERAEFLLSPNPGEELRSLARIASGGELSRILLALKSVAGQEASGQTLVFDEVDAGIGGRVAEIVGRKLRGIASRHQVLCVTHLPQIASLADAHYLVSKRTERGRTVTEVKKLAAEERIDEVARMLGGETVTEIARRHAREMVKQGLRP
jgi:DNA repair protein RecN (Recombination protein N)